MRLRNVILHRGEFRQSQQLTHLLETIREQMKILTAEVNYGLTVGIGVIGRELTVLLFSEADVKYGALSR